MRILFFIILLIFFGCQKSKVQMTENEKAAERIKTEAFQIAENNAKSKLINPSATAADTRGIISFSDSTKRYELDPNMVHIGLIDEDQNTDAIVSMVVYHSNNQITDEQIILLNKNGKLEQVATFDLNLRIIIIANRKITAELHTKPRTSIYYDCVKCKKIVDYEFKNDSLVALY